MKTFYASLIVFFLLLALIVCNGFYVRKATAALEALLSELSRSPVEEAALSNVEGTWQKSKRVLALSVAFEEIRALDEQLLTLRAAASTGSAADFERARLLAIETLVRIRESEGLSIDNLI